MRIKLFKIVSMIVIIGLLSSCGKKEEVPVELQLSKTSGAIVNEGGELSVNVTSNAEWTVSSTADWLSCSPAGGTGNGTITVRANANVAQINALPDGTFCEAYMKLLCQIRERYPKCKVVCIIGDYLSQSVEQSIIDIAGHYGAKTVNLFRVNGFNDLGGYSPETLTNKGRQPNMPKHDYSGDISGCHPGSEAMKFIAEKIYTELGAWLEE